MVYISPEIYFSILEYTGECKSFNIVNKEINNYIRSEREKFLDTPLILNYRLAKYSYSNMEKNVDPNFKRIQVGDYLSILLNGCIPIGDISKNRIIPSKMLLDSIIPEEEVSHYWSSFPSLPGFKIITKWELFDILPNCYKHLGKYKLLFN